MKKLRKRLSKMLRLFILSSTYIWVGIITFIFVTLLLLLLECKGFALNISLGTFNEFNKLMAQILGSFAAILIAFFFVIFQMIESKKISYFHSFRNELEKLKIKLLNIPNNISYIYHDLSKSISFLDNIGLSDGIPARGDEQWGEIYKPIETLRKKGMKYTAFSKKANYYYDDLLSIYGRIEEYLSLLGVQAISIIGSWSILRSMVRIIITVFYFIFSFIIFNFMADSDYQVSSIISFLQILLGIYLSIIYVSSVILHVFDFYREYMNEIVEEDDEG